jgi:anti-sigma B factor antagonist
VTHQASERGVFDCGAGWYRIDPMPACVVVTAGGAIDVNSAAGLHRAVQVAFCSSSFLVIDMSRVSFVDSTGLGVLIGARSRAAECDGSISLVAPPPLVRRLLACTRLRQSFDVFDSRSDAFAAIGAP